MPERWIFLQGAPSFQHLVHAPPDDSQISTRWEELQKPGLDRSLYANDIFAGDEDAEEISDATRIKSVLYERSRLLAEHSRSRSNEESQASLVDDGSLGYSESMLPPPTQHRADRTTNQTTEQSLINLPSWSFSLSSITPLDSLPRAPTHDGNSIRVNLLVLVTELDPPSTIPLKKRSKTGKMDVERAGLSLLDDSGATLEVILWDAFAEKWAGEFLMQGDVIYLEKLAVSEYKGKRQGSTVEGSKLQICYRTARTGRKEDRAFQPDLSLGWDQASKRVKSLVQLAETLGHT